MTTAMWCTTCGARLTAAETEHVSSCPKCGAKGVPCDPSKDYLVEINWHELRILGIWATNWAEKVDDGGKRALRGILSRLERQAPHETPLTLGGELRQVRQAIADGTIPASGIEAVGIPGEGYVVVNGPGAVGFSKPPPSENGSVER